MRTTLLTLIAVLSILCAKAAPPVSLIDGKTLNGWTQVPTNSWTVTNNAMASLGLGRGVIYTASQYSHYRLMFTMRHVSGQPDHQACVLIFCTPPAYGEKGWDALAGIQFQVPNGGHWDYRPGHNNGGGSEFKSFPHPKFDPHQWSRVELLVDAKNGTARMAVAQPVGNKAFGFRRTDCRPARPHCLANAQPRPL